MNLRFLHQRLLRITLLRKNLSFNTKRLKRKHKSIIQEHNRLNRQPTNIYLYLFQQVGIFTVKINIKILRNRDLRKSTHLLCKGGALVDLAGLLLALALEVVGAEAMPLLVQLYVIPLRLFTSKRINSPRLLEQNNFTSNTSKKKEIDKSTKHNNQNSVRGGRRVETNHGSEKRRLPVP